jgi:hypothetical protein
MVSHNVSLEYRSVELEFDRNFVARLPSDLVIAVEDLFEASESEASSVYS